MSVWTEANVERLKSLWAEGKLKTPQIAEAMGFSKNQVICKLHRLGIQGQSGVKNPTFRQSKYNTRASESTKPRRPKKSRAAKAVAVRERPVRSKIKARIETDFALPETGAFGSEAVAALNASSCRWPVGDPRQPNFRFCGAEKTAGSSYCSHHHAHAYGKDRKVG